MSLQTGYMDLISSAGCPKIARTRMPTVLFKQSPSDSVASKKVSIDTFVSKI
jgi:hypothetical protein